MQWASAVSRDPVLAEAVDSAADDIEEHLVGDDADLVLVFVAPHHAPAFRTLPALLAERFPAAQQIGCSGVGVLGDGREVEREASVAIVAARLPDVRVRTFHICYPVAEGASAHAKHWHELLGVDESVAGPMVLLADPFTVDARRLVEVLDGAFPECPKIGGLASGGQRPGHNLLIVDGEVHHAGVVGVLMTGAIEMDTVVAQGCRPIGGPLFVTGSDGNRILELDGQRPTAVLAHLYDSLAPRDRELFRRSLFVGVVMEEGRQEYRHGDFLIRSIVGVDPESGVIVVAEDMDAGQVVQFHLRDASAASEDLETMLRHRGEGAGPRPSHGDPRGALLFSCTGRGEALYGFAGHDSDLIRKHLGSVPIGGFFCNGEIGPVRRRTYLHGFTSSVGIFRTPRADETGE